NRRRSPGRRSTSRRTPPPSSPARPCRSTAACQSTSPEAVPWGVSSPRASGLLPRPDQLLEVNEVLDLAVLDGDAEVVADVLRGRQHPLVQRGAVLGRHPGARRPALVLGSADHRLVVVNRQSGRLQHLEPLAQAVAALVRRVAALLQLVDE